MLAFQEKVKNNVSEFCAKVISIAGELGIDPNWLMAVMNAETGGTFSPSIQNTKYPLKNGIATGLIQFTPDTAVQLGTSIEDLKSMSNVEQLDWVKKYFQPYSGKMNSYFDVYMAVFFPAAIGKTDEWQFQAKNISRSSVARQNPSIDINKDGTITVSEFKQYLLNTIPAKLKNLIFSISEIAKNNPGALLLVGGVLLLYLFTKK